MTGTENLQKKRDTIGELIEAKKISLKNILPKHCNIDRFIKSALLVIARNTTDPKIKDDSKRIINCSTDSLIVAITNAAELGLDFTPEKGHAYLVPYAGEVKFMPGYRGFIDLAKRSGKVTKIEAHVVHKNDTFKLQYGTESCLMHEPTIEGEPGEVIGAYAVAHFKDSEPQFEYMTLEQLNGIRKRAKTDFIWTSDTEEMYRKTTIRRLFKYLPCSVDMEKALNADDAVAGIKDAEIIDITNTENGKKTADVSNVIAQQANEVPEKQAELSLSGEPANENK